MNKKLLVVGMATVFSLGLAACNDGGSKATEKQKVSETSTSETQTITYLKKDYTVPTDIKKVAAASLEAMEDAAVLGVKPTGAITVGGKLPTYLAKDLEGAESIGEKMQPNHEVLLKMKPDVILGTTKFQPEVAEKLGKVATMIPVSHISTDWEANLRLMGEVSGTKEKAEEVIKQYKEDVAKVKASIEPKVKDKEAVVVRIRAGNMQVYPASVYLNPVLYEDLGLTVPTEIKAVEKQEAISIEKFAEMDPDIVFLQFDESENAKTPKVLDELQSNAIWKNLKAVKDNKVFINAVDPLAQGGTAWSKIAFLKAVEDKLTK
ncbi:ABC transporter substrate-binding protein [Priestia taiwanensis]|uniref:Iron-uptake system-binding protein n=1 Tax=Priestia taiwanensis TaxID=1347902 RepID=A0A917APF3_9BACI|nr:ABC transporter substrate-binding protein [Priestia taiwanensis]MBM7362611.1 iron complex transport system substrate-binding protein [Priestia taiwanensis]GGE63640.1 iron-uptake system-binding protein [Priestia taiwanensis]